MSVYVAIQSEIAALGEKAAASSEGQRALVLAAALDDRAGIQAGGLASTDKRLGELMDTIRERFRPAERNGLEVIRGGRTA